MPTIPQAVKVFSVETGENEAFVRQVARDLTIHDELPRSAGKRLEQIDEVGLSKLLLAVFTDIRGSRITDAAERAVRYYKLRRDGDPNGLMFGDFLASAFRTIGDDGFRKVVITDQIVVPFDTLRIEIITSYPAIEVSVVRDLGEERPAFDGSFNFAEDQRTANYWPSFKPRRSTTIPGYLLFLIVHALRRLGDRDAFAPSGEGE
jgi:hypothetical protein